MRSKGASAGEATAAAVVNVRWIYPDESWRKVVYHNIRLFHGWCFTPADDPIIGAHLDDTLGRAQIHTRRPLVTGNERKINSVN